MARKTATAPLLLFIVGLVLFVLPSSCRGAEHQVITKPSWNVIIDGNQSSLPFQPAEIRLPDGVVGAESLAFDRRGEGPYAGVSDGRVLKWDARASVWTTFAYGANYGKLPLCHNQTSGDDRAAGAAANETVCGRPLGLQFLARTGELYIADAYLGLMKVGPNGGEAEVLATEADDGVPFTFVNGLDVDQVTGDAYFTDSSTTYQRRNNIEILRHRDATGRLLKYDARTKRVTVLKSGLPYPNGVALSSSGGRTHVVVAHTWPCRVFRYWLVGPKAGQYELFADLPGYPDNIRRDGRGGYWVALNQEKVDLNATSTTTGAPPPPGGKPHLVGVWLDRHGAELAVMTAPKGVTLSDVSVRHFGKQKQQLWLGSVELGYVGVVDYGLLGN